MKESLRFRAKGDGAIGDGIPVDARAENRSILHVQRVSAEIHHHGSRPVQLERQSIHTPTQRCGRGSQFDIGSTGDARRILSGTEKPNPICAVRHKVRSIPSRIQVANTKGQNIDTRPRSTSRRGQCRICGENQVGDARTCRSGPQSLTAEQDRRAGIRTQQVG